MRRIRVVIASWEKRIRQQVADNRLQQTLLPALNAAITLLLFAGLVIVVYDFGFNPFWQAGREVDTWLGVLIRLVALLMTLRLLLEFFTPKKKWARGLNIGLWLFIFFLAYWVLPHKVALTVYVSNAYVFLKVLLYASVLLLFVAEGSYFIQSIYNRSVNPGILFVGSFALLIMLGVFLLKLPNATNHGISIIDALFTATSAVCITGLTAVDTATQFTTFGHIIIMLLVQAGGLGIMTFAGLLAYAMGGQSSLKSQLALKDMLSSRQVNNVMHFVYRVVAVTLMLEIVGAAAIYLTVSDALFDRKLDRIFFSVFHSISAFCNAGFSTFSGGLYEPVIRFNYPLHLVVALLIIMGSMGFPIVFNLYRYTQIKAGNFFCWLQRNPKRAYFPRVININSRLAILVSSVLWLAGFVVYLIFEQNGTLLQHPTVSGKLITSFFGSVTTRSGGYNTVDMGALTLPTTMVFLLLMWVGASPVSTGGGIRTTTAGLALLNMAAVIRGKDRTEFAQTEISHQSVRRAFAVIVLSLLMIGVSIVLVSINDSDKGLMRVAFEVFSAFSTVGLSLGITPFLSSMSKLVIIGTMFIGRVGMLTLLVAVIRQSKPLYYRYPKEEIVF